MKRYISIMLVALLTICMFVGCAKTEPVTADSLMNGLQEKNLENVSFDMKIDMSMSVNLLGEKSSVSTTINLSIDSTKDVAHLTGSMKSEEDGETETEAINTWITTDEDGTILTYNLEEDIWTVSKNDDTNLTGLKDAVGVLDNTVSYTLREKTEKYNGKACYVIDVVLNFKDVNIFTEDMFDMDLGSEGTVNAVYFFDESSKDLVGVEIDMAETLTNLLQNAMKEELGIIIDLTIDKFKMSLSNISMKLESDVSIPKEVVENAVDADDFNWWDDDDDKDDETEYFDYVDWNEDFDVLTLNGKEYNIRELTVKDLLNAGLESEKNIEDFTINPNSIEHVTFMLDEWSYMSISLQNISEKSIALEDGEIYSISIHIDEDDDVDATIAGVKFNEDTEETLLEKFGQPYRIDRMSSAIFICYEDIDFNEITFTIDNDTGTLATVLVYVY